MCCIPDQKERNNCHPLQNVSSFHSYFHRPVLSLPTALEPSLPPRWPLPISSDLAKQVSEAEGGQRAINIWKKKSSETCTIFTLAYRSNEINGRGLAALRLQTQIKIWPFLFFFQTRWSATPRNEETATTTFLHWWCLPCVCCDVKQNSLYPLNSNSDSNYLANPFIEHKFSSYSIHIQEPLDGKGIPSTDTQNLRPYSPTNQPRPFIYSRVPNHKGSSALCAKAITSSVPRFSVK